MDCGGQGLPNGTFRALCPTGHRAHPRLRTAPGTDGRTGSRMTGKGGAPYGDHHQPDQSAVHPSPEAGGLCVLPPPAGRIPLRQSQAVEGSAAVGGGGPHRCGYGGSGGAGAALGRAAGGGPGGGDEVPLADGDPSGDAVYLRHSHGAAAGNAGGPPLCGAGHLAGPRQRGYHPPHGGRLPCRWNVSGERLRGSL